MTTNRNLDIIYYKRETIVVLPILNIYWQDIFIIRLSHDLCVTHVSQWMEPLKQVQQLMPVHRSRYDSALGRASTSHAKYSRISL